MLVFMSMWWFWMVLGLLLVLPLGYGWGYRGWGAPYPSYFQRRRMQLATSGGAPSRVDHLAWGWGGDVVWLVILMDVLFVTALLWRR